MHIYIYRYICSKYTLLCVYLNINQKNKFGHVMSIHLMYICTYPVWILVFTLNFIHFKFSGHVRGNIGWFIYCWCSNKMNKIWSSKFKVYVYAFFDFFVFFHKQGYLNNPFHSTMWMHRTKPEKWDLVVLHWREGRVQPMNNKTPIIRFTTVDGRNPTPIMVDNLSHYLQGF